ncbi:MAG: hypothetical protein ACRDTE_05430 [Pseudonocardiaceae bacterium]
MSASQHPSDVAERYCGGCHEFHDHMDLADGSELASVQPGDDGPDVGSAAGAPAAGGAGARR